MPQPQEIRFDGVHCSLIVTHYVRGIVVVRIKGTDIGEFGEAPMQAITKLTAGEPFDLFIDARDVSGASIEVSGEWAAWLSSHRSGLRGVTMLTGSRFIQITAEFVRRFASLEGIMRISTDAEIFEAELNAMLKPPH
jgi:hypothetical protein